ncbi:uncharacterized protein LOC109546486 [Dendroctonus ponderosae]|uniref:Protein sleepless n=1 Tax=Dendroctonus ponderosae TaxID=77166 RepID=A0AAR5QIH0_DENPD|nr:uncharacterized protein LOC109546486 [Dendroctonus ponderosae]KAH1016054.1 hypothetical protein HUJ04_007337 [Dendroctonus ponderosae]KAH1025355.1 hypothetical protein HUJ05_010095 [Dendroctonus ponderosae]
MEMPISSRLVTFLAILCAFQEGNAIRCYECVARLGLGDSSPCLYGDRTQLRRVNCMGPSVCAAYHYQTMIPGTPPINHITRGCQALRFGATCEDIFQQLRRRNEILPGQHTCTTCSTDLCNSNSRIMPVFPIIFTFFCLALYRIVFS